MTRFQFLEARISTPKTSFIAPRSCIWAGITFVRRFSSTKARSSKFVLNVAPMRQRVAQVRQAAVKIIEEAAHRCGVVPGVPLHKPLGQQVCRLPIGRMVKGFDAGQYRIPRITITSRDVKLCGDVSELVHQAALAL